MGPGTLKEFRDGSKNHRRVPGRVVGPSRRSETGRGTLSEVRDGSGDHPGGAGRVGGPSRRSETGWGNPFGGSGRVWGLSGRSEMGWETIWEVRDGSVDRRGGSG